MNDSFEDYARSAIQGIRQGAGDVTRHAIADIGDSYQEVLMSSASISPPEGLTGDIEQVTVDANPAPEISAPEMDMEHGQ